MGGIGAPELLIVFLVVLLVFGPTKIPEVARGIGKGIREFRRLSTEFQREINLAVPDEDEPRIERSARPVDDGTQPRGATDASAAVLPSASESPESPRPTPAPSPDPEESK
jgi:TatA/E family protein of Tat protein translocase